MSDNDLIRRGEVRELLQQCGLMGNHPNDPLTVMFNALPAVQPTVKPLVWDRDGRRLHLDDTMQMSLGYDWDGYSLMRQEAYGFECSYIIWPDHIGAKSWNLYGVADGLHVQDIAGEEAAKAAAQADYEARILSALDMQPTVSHDVAALVEALENVIGEYDLFRKYEYERGLAPLDDEIHEARAAVARVKGVM